MYFFKAGAGALEAERLALSASQMSLDLRVLPEAVEDDGDVSPPLEWL